MNPCKRATRIRIAVVLCVLVFSAGVHAGARTPKKNAATTAAPAVHAADPDTMRLDGEQRFRANCGRCHAAPQKFAPRVMSTVVRHMRVRATITDQDMRLILFYMTQ
jgi:cytochrome c5